MLVNAVRTGCGTRSSIEVHGKGHLTMGFPETTTEDRECLRVRLAPGYELGTSTQLLSALSRAFHPETIEGGSFPKEGAASQSN